jgi:hypothetical protein
LSGSGVLSGTPTSATSQPISFTVEVKDGLGAIQSQTYSLTVMQPLALATATLPKATVGSSYTTTFLATGGETPYTYALTSGATQLSGEGMTLSGSGVLSGTPTSATSQPISFTVEVKDGLGAIQSQTYSLTVMLRPAIATISPTSTPRYTHAFVVLRGLDFTAPGLRCYGALQNCGVEVWFGSVRAVVAYASSTELDVITPLQAGTVPVRVVNKGVWSAPVNFTYRSYFYSSIR